MRPIALALTAMLATAGLTVGIVLPSASAAPVISIATDVPGSVLSGEDIPISITATNPPGDDVYNLSFNYSLPPGVTYVPGSSTVSTSVTDLPDPQIIPIYVVGSDPLELDHYVLVWTNVSDLVNDSAATLSFSTRPDESTYIVGTTVPSGAFAGAYGSTDPRAVPDFDPLTGVATGDFDADAEDTDPGQTQVSAISVSKSDGGLPESELMRGVHDQVTTYAITVRVTDQTQGGGGVEDLVVIDWLPANLEFLGCGGVDNSAPGFEEYPLSGRLGQAGTVPSCEIPTAVETVQLTSGIPGGPSAPGVYTKVTWTIPAAAAGSSTTIRYQAGVPLFENTMTWAGGSAPSPVSGFQGSNLDNNNNGASTREPNGGPESATNSVLATAEFLGTVDPSSSTTQSASTSTTVTVHDLAVQKRLESPGQFTPGVNAVFELTLLTSEYATAEALVLADPLPSGMCPMAPVGFVG